MDQAVPPRIENSSAVHALRGPGVAGYVVAVALLAVGVSAFLLVVLPARSVVRDAVFGLQRVTLPTGGLFQADQAGPVTLFYEKRSVLDAGEVFPAGTAFEGPMRWDGPALEAVAIDADGVESGTIVAGQPWSGTGTDSGSLVYNVPPYVGESLATVDLPAPGTFRLAYAGDSLVDAHAEAAEPGPEDHRVIAIGHVPVDLLKSGLRGVYGGAVVLGILGVAALLLAVITWSRRRDAMLNRNL